MRQPVTTKALERLAANSSRRAIKTDVLAANQRRCESITRRQKTFILISQTASALFVAKRIQNPWPGFLEDSTRSSNLARFYYLRICSQAVAGTHCPYGPHNPRLGAHGRHLPKRTEVLGVKVRWEASSPLGYIRESQ